MIPPVYASRWAELIPHAKVVRIRDAGHMLPYEQPEAFVASLVAFLG